MRRKKTISKNPGAKSALEEFFKDELRGIYWTENHLLKILPSIQEAATSKNLVATISKQIQLTESNILLLEQIFQLLKEKPQTKKSETLEGIAKDGEADIKNTAAGTTERDLGIVLTSQKIEFHKIATYGTLLRLSTSLGLANIAGLLSAILTEEKKTEKQLTEFNEKEMKSSEEDPE
jgi:ferritin-like metal-binding protein YciE